MHELEIATHRMIQKAVKISVMLLAIWLLYNLSTDRQMTLWLFTLWLRSSADHHISLLHVDHKGSSEPSSLHGRVTPFQTSDSLDAPGSQCSALVVWTLEAEKTTALLFSN